jgi:hypothetical protein
MTSQRVLSGSIVKGSTVVMLASEGDINNDYKLVDDYIRDGYNVINRKHQFALSLSAKTNASDTILYDGKPTGNAYNDTRTSNLGDRQSGEPVYFGNQRQTVRLNHVIEKRDLGQSLYYEGATDFVETIDPNDPIAIMNIKPDDLYLPISMVDFSSVSAKDGVIEPLDIRSKIARTLIDIPFYIRGVRGSLAEETPFRKSAMIKEGYNLNDDPAVPYLDAPEYFGNVELPPVFHEDKMKIKPFVDTSNVGSLYFSQKEKNGYNISADIVATLVSGSSFSTADMEEFDIIGRRGHDYEGQKTDSIAFGGLLK